MISGTFEGSFGDLNLQAQFQLSETGFYGIYGRSGSGKSTLLRCIAGLEHAQGRLEVEGVTWQDDAQGVFVLTEKRKVGLVSQSPFLFPHLNVRKNLEFGYRYLALAEQKIKFAEVVAAFDLGALLERSTDKLSGGEIQRVALARTLLTSPKLLLLDEPLSGLDTESKAEILPYFERLQTSFKIPGFYVSHDLSEIERLCPTRLKMLAGQLVS